MSTVRAVVYGRESKDKSKSIDDQVAVGADAVAEQGWTHVGSYDDGSSASRYATKVRPGWTRLLADLEAGAYDVIVLWETTRGDRTLATWVGLVDRCRAAGVRIHVVSDERTFDPRKARDYRDLASAGVDAAYETDRSSDRIQRGVASSARSGRPPMGPSPYGYRRVYDPATGKLAGQYVDLDDGGRRWEGGQEPDPDVAPIVREIFRRVAKGEPLGRIADDLNARGVPPPGSISHTTGSRQWYRERIRTVATNPVYIGKRRHRATGRNALAAPDLYTAGWEPLVAEATFYAAVRVLRQPGRRTTLRPGRQSHLLTYLATCHRGHPARATSHGTVYTCDRGCVHVKREPVDDLVRDRVLAYLRRPDVYRLLRKAGEDADREIVAAEDEVERLKGDLDDWRASTTDGRGTTPETMAVVEADLSRKIKEARQRADRAGLSPTLRPFLEPGADLEARWREAPLPARRDVIRALVVVELLPSGRNWTVPAEQRVRITPIAAG